MTQTVAHKATVSWPHGFWKQNGLLIVLGRGNHGQHQTERWVWVCEVVGGETNGGEWLHRKTQLSPGWCIELVVDTPRPVNSILRPGHDRRADPSTYGPMLGSTWH